MESSFFKLPKKIKTFGTIIIIVVIVVAIIVYLLDKNTVA
jgi:hypothetical protein